MKRESAGERDARARGRERERGEEKRDCEKIEEGKRGEGVLPAVHDRLGSRLVG